MCDHAKILELMELKRQLLRSIEDVTQEMITCPSERLETLMIQRDRLVSKLQKADGEMKEHCDGQEDGPAVLDAAICKEDPQRLTGTLLDIYYLGQQQRASLVRLRDAETQAILRLKQEQLEILEKIKEASQRGTAKATRFFSVGTSYGGSSRLGHA